MPDKLPEGTQLSTLFGENITIKQFLAEGGQGSVYIIDYNGEPKALKWYKPSALGKEPESFYNNIKDNIIRKAPNKDFLWPLDITNWKDNTFGYVMDICPDDFYDITDFMLTNVRFKSFKTIIDAALRITSAFRILHNQGYSYLDLNDGNFFINPETGQILICDNDNVAPDGKSTGILGKPRYMAPEIVVGGGSVLPDTQSDLHSLSVILYILFCLNHPLEGKRYLAAGLTDQMQNKLYGTEPIFMMDPTDDRNRPDPDIHSNSIKVWNVLPDYMKKIFLKSFSKESFQRPSVRPTEVDWLKNLTRFRSDIVQCVCGNEVFVSDSESCECEHCHRKIHIPYRFELEDYDIPALNGTRIYRGQLGTCREEEVLQTVGIVLSKKNNPNSCAIQNKTDTTWRAITPSGKRKNVEPGEFIPLKDGIQFDVYGQEITIRENK